MFVFLCFLRITIFLNLISFVQLNKKIKEQKYKSVFCNDVKFQKLLTRNDNFEHKSVVSDIRKSFLF